MPIIFRSDNFELASDGTHYTATVRYTSRRFKAGRELGYLTVKKGDFEFAGMLFDIESMQLICDKTRKHLVPGRQEVTTWACLNHMIYFGNLILQAPINWQFRWLDVEVDTTLQQVKASCYLWPFDISDGDLIAHYAIDAFGDVVDLGEQGVGLWWVDDDGDQVTGDWAEYIAQFAPDVIAPQLPNIRLQVMGVTHSLKPVM